MQRLNNDRGAVAVIVAILMVPLLGFAAISIDIAATYSERQQLQTGADAAALAIAQDCARENARCDDAQTSAEQLAQANSHDGEVSVDAKKFPSRVRVTNDGVREHWFAPVLGIDTTDIHTSATAGWGAVSGGDSGLPLAFSLCQFNAQTGGGAPSNEVERVVNLPKKADTPCPGSNSGNPVPGGFGWIVQGSGPDCSATTRLNGWINSDNGNNIKCSSAELKRLRGKVLILPIYNKAENKSYRVHAYAAFKLTGYFFGNNERWNIAKKNNDGCTPSNYCIKGYFTKFVAQSGDFDSSPAAPNLGASVVELLPDT